MRGSYFDVLAFSTGETPVKLRVLLLTKNETITIVQLGHGCRKIEHSGIKINILACLLGQKHGNLTDFIWECGVSLNCSLLQRDSISRHLY